MLSPSELSHYLSELPKDLTLKISSKQYKVNKEFASSLSNYISKKITENPKLNTILIEQPDPFNIFSIVVSFLNGKKIDITPDNDYALFIFATFLEIQSLKSLTEESLHSPLSVDNIIQRILNENENIPDNYISFFEENIEPIIRFHLSQTKDIEESKIFNLDPLLLSKIIHSDNSRFANDSSRYSFALNCCQAFYSKYEDPEQLSLFISSDDISKIPDDVIRQVITNEHYDILDGQFQSIMLAQRLVSEIISLQNQIIEVNQEFSQHEEELKAIREEDERIMEQKTNSDIKLNEVGQRRYKLAQSLLNSAGFIDKKAPSLSQFIVYKSITDAINTNLSSLDQKCENLKRILIKISGTKVIYADLRAKGLELTKQFESLLKSLYAMMNMLVPNEDDINELIEEFRQISKKLHQMADTLVNLDGNEQ